MTTTEDAIERLRELAARRVESTSLRSVARQIGLSPSGLKKLIDGSAPYRPTVTKLMRWAAREEPAGRLREREGALTALLDNVPPGRRAEVRAELLQVLANYETPPQPEGSDRRRSPAPPGKVRCDTCGEIVGWSGWADHQEQHRQEILP